MTVTLERISRFTDMTFPNDKSNGSKIDNEFDRVFNFINNWINGFIQQNHLILKAPDGKLFEVTVVYAADGVTPTLQIQQVTFP